MYLSSGIAWLFFWPYFFLTKLPERILALLKHIFVVPFVRFDRNAYNRQKLSGFQKFAGSVLWWLAVLVSKTLDLTGLWEIMDLLFALVKFNTRKMTETEIREAQKVFGDSLPYSAIRIDEKSLFAWIGAKSVGKSQLGLVTFRTVNFTRKINCRPGNPDMDWLIHELVHVRQMQVLGAQYLFEALYAQHTSGYGYGGIKTLQQNHKLCHFNLEQQAEIAQHFYKRALYGERDESIYQTYIEDIREGRF